MITPPKIHYLSVPSQSSLPSKFERFLAWLSQTATEPKSYGWFHWFWLILTLILCIVVGFTCQKVQQKRVKTVLGVVAVGLLLLETYKQFTRAYDASTNTWSYSWGDFPFQFCSTPMYIMALAAIAKPGKRQNALYSFLATYSLFAGILVMLVPESVFCETIGINIQTMVHHGAMIVVGVFLYATKSVVPTRKTVVHGAPVFAVVLFIALVLNATYAAIGDTTTHNFNMFYLARSGDTPMDFIDEIFKAVPYPLILFGYAGGFTAMGFFLSLTAMGIRKAYAYAQSKYAKKQKKSAHKQQETAKETEETAKVKEAL